MNVTPSLKSKNSPILLKPALPFGNSSLPQRGGSNARGAFP